MANILKEHLRESLYIPNPDDMAEWKSPEQLQHKVICRTSVRAPMQPRGSWHAACGACAHVLQAVAMHAAS